MRGAPQKDDPLICFRDFVRRDRTIMVYHLEKYNLKVKFTHLGHKNPEVVVTLGPEVRTFQLEGFINFWLDMLKVGRKPEDPHLMLLGSTDSSASSGRPMAYGL